MRNSKFSFSIVDFLMVIAVLMILAGLVGPRFAAAHGKADATHASHVVVPVSQAR